MVGSYTTSQTHYRSFARYLIITSRQNPSAHWGCLTEERISLLVPVQQHRPTHQEERHYAIEMLSKQSPDVVTL